MKRPNTVVLAALALLTAVSSLPAGPNEVDLTVPKQAPSVGLADKMLSGPLADVQEIVYAVRGPGREWHFYANFGYVCQAPENKKYGVGPGLLCKLDLRSGKRTVLLEDPDGAIRDPAVHYDGKTILFSYRKGGSEHYYLYEIQSDGTGLRQITGRDNAPFDDIEPCYMPDDSILFASSRCGRYVPCLHTQVAICHRVQRDGTGLRQLSTNVETESTPWPLPDGRVIFMRWEYVHRGVMAFHHLWTMNPDGTGQMIYYGNMHEDYPELGNNVLMTEPRPIPGTDKIAAIFCPGHGRSEHRGYLYEVDPRGGPDKLGAILRISGGLPVPMKNAKDIPTVAWRDPYPIIEECYLLASGQDICLMDGQGRYEAIHTAQGNMVHEPRPLVARPREPVIADRTDWSKTTGTMMLSDIRIGRNMTGVDDGTVTDLLLLEVLPNPVHFGTGKETLGGSHFIKRVLGTVPVESDGSAYFEMPAMRAVQMIALDQQGRSVKRMNSFVSVMPGEVTGCVGCHEHRTVAPPPIARSVPVASTRQPSALRPVEGVPQIIDFPRDIQPILDRHCVKCHDRGGKGKGLLNGEWSIGFTNSYRSLNRPWNVAAQGTNTDPYSRGSGNSKLVTMLAQGHQEVKLSQAEQNTLRLWVDCGGTFSGTYGSLGAVELVSFDALDRTIFEKRCYECHIDKVPKPRRGGQRTWPEHKDLLRWINLTRPDLSELATMPLSAQAGGQATLTDRKAKPARGQHYAVFSSTQEADYQALLASLRGFGEHLAAQRWYGATKDWMPNEHYLREMHRYGALPAPVDRMKETIDPFQVDQRYFELFYPQGK